MDPNIAIFSQGTLEFDVLEKFAPMNPIIIATKLQNHEIRGPAPLTDLKISKAKFATDFDTLPSTPPPWPFTINQKKSVLPQIEEKSGILLAKNFQANGIKIGDEGYLAYSASTLLGMQEMHIPVYVSGFYDPGIMAVGNKCILVPSKITQAINASESAFTLDPGEANRLLVWLPNIKEADKVKTALLEKLKEKKIDKYWNVQTFREYEFAKDLMQQFESDKYLFTLIGIIILLVACTNIISLLVLMVSEKKKEIGILRAMGAKRRSIAAIFTLSGASLGFFSSLFGVILAFITLKNIDVLVHLLSTLQGHQAFGPQFFGTSLPHDISSRALLFAVIATPLLAFLAGLFPAIKASRLNPCETLRSQ